MPEAMINGFKHYWEEGGSGEVLIMIHGAAGSGRQLARQIPEFSKTFRVVVPDLRGMGQSAHPSAIPPEAWSEDIKGLIDHLGGGPAHLYGTSLGARVVLRAAIDYPASVRSLALDSPIVANEAAGNAQLNANLGNFDSLSPEQQAQRAEQHGSDWRSVLETYFRTRNEPAVQEHYNLRESCKSITIPTLILRGDFLEPVHPLAHAFELRDSIKDSWLWIRPNHPTGALAGGGNEVYDLIKANAARQAALVGR
jgi:pimeloyl-ACP methyl ester carboxylesterase